ncbi:MAG: flagellar basal body-associated FliL family protein [Thauera sp.]
MAKAPAKAEEGDDVPKKKGKLGLIIVIVLLVVLILIAVGVGALVLLKGGKDKTPEEQAAAAAPAATQVQTPGTVDLAKPPTFIPLDAFTVNLRRDEGDHYLQVVAVLRVADATMDPTLKAFMPEIRHRINLLLSSKPPSEIATIEGRQALALSITEQTNEALGFKPVRDAAGNPVPNGPVQAVLFTSFIIQ